MNKYLHRILTCNYCQILKFGNSFFIGLLFVFYTATSVYAQAKQPEKKANDTPSKNKNAVEHKVLKGETLYKIAKTYSVSVNDLVKENPESIDGIKDGQILKIPKTGLSTSEKEIKSVDAKPKPPVTSTVAPTSSVTENVDTAKYIIHLVEKGQTMYSIAKKYTLTEEDIVKANPAATDGLKKGMMLLIPKKNSKSTIAVQQKKIETVEPKIEKKDLYNIALFLPFVLEKSLGVDVDKIAKGDESFSGKTEVAVSFYNGFILALDSLKKTGVNYRLFVYDVDENDSAKVVELMSKPELKQMDLFVGPLYNSSFSYISKFAKENKIHCVTPLSQQNKILFNNPYVSKVIPSQIHQLNYMSDYIVDKYTGEHLVLVTNMSLKDVDNFSTVKTHINERLKQKNVKKEDSLVVAKGMNGLSSLVSGKKNIFILPTNNQVFVTDFITKIHNSATKYHVEVFGLPSWRSFDNLDLDYLDTLHFQFPSASFVDASNPQTAEFIARYQNRFLSDPEVYAFQGYDIGMYYLGLLANFGKNISSFIANSTYTGLQSNYKMYKHQEESGVDNQAVFILKQSNYTILRVN
ncbi:MAG: LysM peptidoglycan-binding domain-containing protein [Bacteroidetes bacterium]|nr:LysM peptidoglycan-binding domain-containing protein [Bacteroidota bacterium]